jgi:hypothetical protein
MKRDILNSISALTFNFRYCPVPQLSRQCAEFAASLKELKQFQIALELLFRAKLYITSKQTEDAGASSNIVSGSTTTGTSIVSGPIGSGGASSTVSDEGKSLDSELTHNQRHERDAVKLQILFEMGSISILLFCINSLLHLFSLHQFSEYLFDFRIYLKSKDKLTNCLTYTKNS